MAVGFTTTFVGAKDILKRLDMLPDEITAQMKSKFSDAASATYDDSQAAVPVLSGDLKDSASITVNDTGYKWYYEVSYGDVTGGSSTSKQYSYDTAEGPVKADGYAWFVELSTYKMAAQPFLGPAFYTHAEKLLTDLAGMFS